MERESEENMPKVNVELISGRKWVKRAALRTVHKKPITDSLSNDGFSRMLIPEHSPIRLFRIWVDMDMLEDRVHTHLVRHRRTNPFVGTLREDWCNLLGLNREEYQDSNGVWLRGMGWELGADQLIHVGRQRLCKRAYSETRVAVQLIKDELEVIEPCVAELMLPTCVWYGFCPETVKCCGHTDSFIYNVERAKLINRVNDLS